MKLFTYWRSSAAYRARIALNLKNIPYETVAVHLLKNGGEQKSDDYKSHNPQGLIPALFDSENKCTVNQSLSIIEYLDEVHPTPLLVHGNAEQKAVIRQISQLIACDIHPLDNLRVLQYLTGELGLSDEQKNTWYLHWIREGFIALEKILTERDAKDFCVGNQPSMADACLIPQVYNAHRFKLDMTDFPRIEQINAHCLTLEPFIQATPENQPDANT